MKTFPMFALVLVSCASLPREARRMFSSDMSCPPDHVTVTPQGHYQPPLLSASPPADVAADPVRSGYWHKTHAAQERAPNFCGDLFDATGCGQQSNYCCKRVTDSPDGVNTEYTAFCEPFSRAKMAEQAFIVGQQYLQGQKTDAGNVPAAVAPASSR